MKNGSMNKPIIIALLLVAFITMLLGWVGLSGDVKDELKDQYGDEAYEVAYDELSESLESEMSYGILDSELGNTKIAKDAKAVLRTVKDLKLTPGELGVAASGIISISNTINHYLEKASDEYGYDYDYDYDSDIESLIEIGFAIKFGVIVYRMVFYLAMLSILLAALRVVVSNKDLGYIPLILCGLIFVTMTAGVIYLNSTVYENTEMNILALRLWPFITLVSLIAARLLSRTLAGAGQEMAFAGLKTEAMASSAILKDKGEKVLDSIKSGVSNFAQSGAANNSPWTCPDCQHDCLPTANFCPICGKIKPAPKKCLNCGSILPDDSVFCQKCGTKYEKIIFCGFCGKKLINDERCDCESTNKTEQASSEQTLS